MAKLKSIFPFTGSIGDVTGYRGPDGVDRVRKKSNLNKERLHRDEAFAASRMAWPYMGMASQAGAAIRHALHPLLKDNKDYATSHRLVGICQRALRKHHPDRTPEFFDFMDAKGDLEGFSLVEGRSLWPHLEKLVVSEPDYGTGMLQIVANGWELSGRNLQRSGATHLRWRVIVAALPQGKATQRHFEVLNSEWFALERKPLPDGSLPPQTWVCDVPFAKYLMGDGQAIVAMGIEVAQRFGEKFEVMVSVRGFDILRIIGGQGQIGLLGGHCLLKDFASASQLGAGEGLLSAPHHLEDFAGAPQLSPECEEDLAPEGADKGFELGADDQGSFGGATGLVPVQDWEGLVVAGVLDGAMAGAPSAQTGAGIGFDGDFVEGLLPLGGGGAIIDAWAGTGTAVRPICGVEGRLGGPPGLALGEGS